ncbi:MAG: GntR family transcriptional regulator [Caulobacteraceae bacterium]
MTAANTKAEAGPRLLKRQQGFVEEIFQIIRADILSLRIPPDSRISIDSLARELGVSQTPIREALSMLEGVGLVAKERFVGYCSAPQLNRQQFDELYEARLLMEPFAARQAAERMSDAEIKALSDLAKGMEPGDSHSSYHRFADQDSHLHDPDRARRRQPHRPGQPGPAAHPPAHLPPALPQRSHDRGARGARGPDRRAGAPRRRGGGSGHARPHRKVLRALRRRFRPELNCPTRVRRRTTFELI